MKPNFALKLSNEGIELVHRAASGWLSVGSLDFAADDVARGCADLISEANRLAPEGIRTKLVLPGEETRYTSLVAPGPTDEARRYQIEAEIEALTPYSVDELVYDWVVEGDSALVVICAKETLDEAEGFAEGYGFNPVCFVAAPDGEPFNGEPFFGLTSVADSYLPRGETLQRDAEPVNVIGTAPKAAAGRAETPNESTGKKPAGPAPAAPADAAKTPPAATASASPAATPAAKPPAAASGRPRVEIPPRPAAAAPQGTRADTPPPPRRAVPSMPAMPAMPSEPLAKVGGLVRRMGTRLRREQAREEAQKPVTPPASSTPATPQRAADTPAAGARPDAHEAGNASPNTASPAPDRDGPVAFASRRRPEPTIAASGPGASPDSSSPGGRIAVTAGAAAAGNASPGFVRGLVKQGRGLGDKARALMPRRAEAGDASTPRRLSAQGPEPIVAASRPPASEREKATEAEALTIFGARGNQVSRSVLGGPALVASGAVLLLVVAVAAWVLYFRSGAEPTQLAGLGDANGGQVETPAGDPIEAPAAIEAPDPAPENGPAQQAGIDGPAPQDNATAAPPEIAGQAETRFAAQDEGPAAGDETAPQGNADPERLLEALVDEALNEAMPGGADGQGETLAQGETPPPSQDEATVPAPGQDVGTQVATRAGGGETVDAPQLASNGTAVPRLSLPTGFDVPPLEEAAFTAPPPPPPPGTNFDFDERGLVEATPEGALTPSGVTVFAGRPDVVPAPRPLAAVPPELVPPDFPRADPALAEFRPRPRSEAIQEAVQQFLQEQEEQSPAPEPPAGDQQDARLQPVAPVPVEDPGPQTEIAALDAPDTPPDGGVSLAALSPQGDLPRPQRRPTDLVSPQAPVTIGVPGADAPVETPAGPDAGAPVETAEGPGIDLEGATEEAVAASVQPRDRPSDVAERAQAALAELAEADEEPEERQAAVRSAQPEIPTSASVARAATQSDAIRLNRVNLIGVFGTSDDRRALVRLSSGRVVRVQVGDRLDGGEVTAIGQDELRYTKSGRTELLEIEG